MTGHGGWPLNVFLTPDQEPFFGGTYWPPKPRAGMASFSQVLEAVAELWRERRDEALAPARRLTARLGERRPAPIRRPSRLTARRDRGRRWTACAAPSTLATAASAARRSSRPHCVLELLAALGEREMSTSDAAGDGARRHLRPGRRRLLALLRSTRPGPCRTSRRCSTTTRCSPAPICMHGRRRRAAVRAHLPRDARVLPARAARARRRLLLLTRRRLRGGRGPLLRLERSRSCGRSSAISRPAAIAYFGASERGQLRGRERARGARARAGGARARFAPACWPRAPGAFARRSTTSG